MPPHDEPDWAAVKTDYLANRLTVSEIALKHGVSQARVHRRRHAESWPMRRNKGMPFRADLITRMIRLVEHQVRQLELGAGRTDGIPDEKETMQMDRLTRTLEKLTELERRRRAEEPVKKSRNPELIKMREELIARMREIEAE